MTDEVTNTAITVDPADVSTPDVRIHIAGTTPGESVETKALIETVANTPEAFLAQQVVTLGPVADELRPVDEDEDDSE